MSQVTVTKARVWVCVHRRHFDMSQQGKQGKRKTMLRLSMKNAKTLKGRQLHGIHHSLFLLFTPVLKLLWHAKTTSCKSANGQVRRFNDTWMSLRKNCLPTCVIHIVQIKTCKQSGVSDRFELMWCYDGKFFCLVFALFICLLPQMCFLNKVPFTLLFPSTLLLLDMGGCHILSASLFEVHWAFTWQWGILPCPSPVNIGLNLPPLILSKAYRKPLKYPVWQHHGCKPINLPAVNYNKQILVPELCFVFFLMFYFL